MGDGLGVGEHVGKVGTLPVRILTVPARSLDVGRVALDPVGAERSRDLTGRRLGPMGETCGLGLGCSLGLDELDIGQVEAFLVVADDRDLAE